MPVGNAINASKIQGDPELTITATKYTCLKAPQSATNICLLETLERRNKELEDELRHLRHRVELISFIVASISSGEHISDILAEIPDINAFVSRTGITLAD